jgi:hypothetical protein
MDMQGWLCYANREAEDMEELLGYSVHGGRAWKWKGIEGGRAWKWKGIEGGRAWKWEAWTPWLVMGLT